MHARRPRRVVSATPSSPTGRASTDSVSADRSPPRPRGRDRYKATRAWFLRLCGFRLDPVDRRPVHPLAKSAKIAKAGWLECDVAHPTVESHLCSDSCILNSLRIQLRVSLRSLRLCERLPLKSIERGRALIDSCASSGRVTRINSASSRLCVRMLLKPRVAPGLTCRRPFTMTRQQCRLRFRLADIPRTR